MKKVVVAFGRMNPPTIGHKKLADKINAIARKENADARIYLSHTSLQTDPKNKKDPLSYDQKVKFARKAFGSMVTTSPARTLIDVMKELQKQGYTDVIKVAGSDRVKEYDTLLNKYNGKDYTFDSIKVVSAGERDPDAQGATGMSASKMRAAVQDDDFASFKLGTPKGVDAKQMFDAVKKSMGINEMLEEELQLTEADLEFDDDELDRELFGVDINQDDEFDELDPDEEDLSALDLLIPDEDLEDEDEEETDLQERKPLTLQQRLKLGRRMKKLAPRLARYRKIKAKRVAPPDRLQYRARKAAIKLLRKRVAGKKGESYNNLPTAQKIAIDNMIQKKMSAVGNIAKRLLPKIKKKEMERVAKARTSKKESFDFQFENFLVEKESPKKVEQDPDVKDLPGTQPKKYYKGLSDKEKEARAKQFAKGADKPDDDPASYKPALGDADAKTKPSKYTIKYKKMFGEAVGNRGDDDREADKNIIVQLRKVVDSKGNHPIVFGDGRKVKVKVGDAAELLSMFKKIQKPTDKAKFQDYISKSHGNIKHLLGAGYDIPPIRVSMISGSVDEAFESEIATDEAFDELIETLEQLDEKKSKKVLKAFSIYYPDPTRTPLSHAVPSDNYQLESDDMLTTKINNLLRMGLADKADLEKYRRALKSGEKGLTNPILRKAMLDILDKLLNIVNDDSTTFQRVRNAILKGRTDTGKIEEQEAVATAKDRIRREKEADKRRHDAMLDRARLRDTRAKNREEEYGDLEEKSIEGLKKKSEKSGVPYGILKKVYDRGMAAWKTGHRPGTTPQQWAFARVNSFLTGGGARKSDSDLWAKAREAKKSKKESVGEENPCWDGYKQVGMKKGKDGKPVPNCVREETLEEMPRWLLEPLSKVTRKKGYTAAKKVLKDVLDRKKKEGGKKGLPHTIEYYAGQIARQFDGVDARVLATMVEEKDLSESMITAKPVGVGFTMFAKDFDIRIPNTFEHHPDTVKEMEDRSCCDDCEDYFDHMVEESEYEGKKVKLNDPFRAPSGSAKKFYVYVKNEKGNVIRLGFGDPNMEIKRDDPDRRSNFRARHNCDNPGPKWKARYWSCWTWRSGKPVSKIV